MGSIGKNICNTCDFEYNTNNANFYFNEDLTEYDEQPMLFSTGRHILSSPLKGSVELAYCKECEIFIKIYVLTENKTGLSDTKIEELILDYSFDKYGPGTSFGGNAEKDYVLRYLEKNKLEKIVVTDKNASSINCPECNKKLDILKYATKCPKCEKGILDYNLMAKVD